VIDIEHILRANTVLTRAEQDMSKALGEFGASKNAAVMNRIAQILDKTTKPMQIHELWALMSQEVDKLESLVSVMRGMVAAEKAMLVDDGFLLKKKVVEKNFASQDTLDWGYLTPQEQEIRA
jgi:DNA mismatch repair ATPase MutS